ncbi:hypothetical protein J8F10_04815 [Gemmata sp. G18]|uniref:Carboxypeptidase regulatory-like domain-containing protein n=1 Tax=Gemmata palustris TaxID=2822762 RepID=A0ABS5BMT0_9BACT|nr:hypothetical protein [Gemmata palustris]MBP3954605.1 hypothetical protein [Gemmata palustris]
MPRTLSLSRVTASLSLALMLLAGCGSPAPVAVSGKITMPPKTKLVDTDIVTLVFEPEDKESGKSENATASLKDLSFTAKLVPGKYKIGVTVQVYPGQGGQKESADRSREFQQQFGGFSINSTPLRLEVTKDSGQTITVDLDKKSVGK